mgnify:CR=1 FL=1
MKMLTFIRKVFIFLVIFPTFAIAEELELVCEGTFSYELEGKKPFPDAQETVVIKLKGEELNYVQITNQAEKTFKNEKLSAPGKDGQLELEFETILEIKPERISVHEKAAMYTGEKVMTTHIININRYNGKFKSDEWLTDLKTKKITQMREIRGQCKKGKQAF